MMREGQREEVFVCIGGRVCERERERERDCVYVKSGTHRQTDRQTDRQRQNNRDT
jgi:hypothetical protein